MTRLIANATIHDPLVLLVALALTTTGCEVKTTGPAAPPANERQVDVNVKPGAGVEVDVDRPGVRKDVDIDVKPGAGVDVDVKK